jgi:hypothetical protein
MQEKLLVHAPLYVLTTTTPCWRCGAEQSVIGLGCHNVTDHGQELAEAGNTSELILLNNIVEMPPQVLELMNERNPRYTLHYSQMAEESYYANLCSCGANFGDHFLYSEPGGAFFPESVVEAQKIRIERLPCAGTLAFDCAWSMGMGQYILEYGQKT